MAASHMGVAINPSTLKDGSLVGAFDTYRNPMDGTTRAAKVGASVGTIGVPVVTPAVNNAAGTLPAGTYSYKVAALNADGEGKPSAAVTGTVTGGTSTVTLTWPATTGEVLGWRVYGRVAGAWALLGTVAHGASRTFADNGSVTPGAAIAPVRSSTSGQFEGNTAPRPSGNGYQTGNPGSLGLPSSTAVA